MAKCVCCEREDSKYKCSRCLTRFYCSVACCKKHFEECTLIACESEKKDNPATEEGEVETTVTPSRFEVLKGNVQLKEWMVNNKALLRQMLTSPDPLLAVQKQRKSNKTFNDLSIKILSLL